MPTRKYPPCWLMGICVTVPPEYVSVTMAFLELISVLSVTCTCMVSGVCDSVHHAVDDCAVAVSPFRRMYP